MHHYCFGLVHLQRALRGGTKSNERGFHYQSAVTEIQYMLNLVDDTFPLLPEMLTRRGDALAQLRRYADAEASYRRAAEVKRDYWPAYRGWAQLYIDQGRRRDAQKLLEDNIGQVSDQRVLEKMLADLRRGAK
jgi:tetratricopeptide (TPR) repeat protein